MKNQNKQQSLPIVLYGPLAQQSVLEAVIGHEIDSIQMKDSFVSGGIYQIAEQNLAAHVENDYLTSRVKLVTGLTETDLTRLDAYHRDSKTVAFTVFTAGETAVTGYGYAPAENVKTESTRWDDQAFADKLDRSYIQQATQDMIDLAPSAPKLAGLATAIEALHGEESLARLNDWRKRNSAPKPEVKVSLKQ